MKPSSEVEVVVMVRQRFAANGCASFETPVEGFVDAVKQAKLPPALVDEILRAFVQAASLVVVHHEGRRR